MKRKGQNETARQERRRGRTPPVTQTFIQIALALLQIFERVGQDAPDFARQSFHDPAYQQVDLLWTQIN